MMTEEQLDLTLTGIDEELRARNVPIVYRSFHGYFDFLGKANVTSSHPLADKAREWFSRQYGSRELPDELRGNVPVLLRGDVYCMKLPIFWGPMEICCEPVRPDEPHVIQPPHFKVVDHVVGLTAQFSARLTYEELRELRLTFAHSYRNYGPIRDAESSTLELIKEGCADRRLAIAALLHSVPSNGLSKWQSLQSTEKFLKAYIAKQGQKYPWSHDVVELACVGERLGLRGLAYKDLVEVQCTTHVRYDKSLVTVREAVDAFSAGLRICSSVAVGLGFPYDMQ